MLRQTSVADLLYSLWKIRSTNSVFSSFIIFYHILALHSIFMGTDNPNRFHEKIFPMYKLFHRLVNRAQRIRALQTCYQILGNLNYFFSVLHVFGVYYVTINKLKLFPSCGGVCKDYKATTRIVRQRKIENSLLLNWPQEGHYKLETQK